MDAGMPCTVLNVDDHAELLYVRGKVLRDAGFDVVDACNGVEAQQLAKAQLPALVLLDVRLGDTNGFAVCKRLKSDPETARIPVLHVSTIRKSEHSFPEV